MVLLCNAPERAAELLGGLRWDVPAVSLARLARMHGRPHPATRAHLRENGSFVRAVQEVASLGLADGNLPLA